MKKGFDAIEALLSQDSRSDPVFVALYHLKVPPHLVEWARRRRSYYYLGATSMIAITFGLMSGFLLGVMQSGFSPESPLVSWGSTWANHPLRWPLLAISAVIVSFFIISALWLANRMKNDADQMELAWALIECSDIARKKLGLKDK